MELERDLKLIDLGDATSETKQFPPGAGDGPPLDGIFPLD